MQPPDTTLMGDFPPVSYEQWRERVERDLKGADFDRRLVHQSLDGVTVQPIYLRRDWPGNEDEGGLAGRPPYRRGALPEGRFGDNWDMRQRYAHPDLGQARAEIAADLKRGVRSLWLALDSASATAATPAGDGLLIADAKQLADLLADVPLADCPVSLEPGPQALAAAASLCAVAEARGVALTDLRGGFGCDPLGSLSRSGELSEGYAAAELGMTALAHFAIEAAPGMRAVTVHAGGYHDAGANSVTEIGVCLATGLAYLRSLTGAGLAVDAAAGQIQFAVSVGSDFFTEIAKLRALRQTWAQLVAACGGGAAAQLAVVHARTSLRTKTARDPWVNMLRATTEAFSAAVAGADAVTTDGFDVAIGPSDGFARRIASNLQVVLNEESHVARVADPAGGSYYVEHLTDALAQGGWAEFQTIEREGGMLASLSSGALAERIAATAAEREKLLRRRKQAITGVNEFANLDEAPVARPTPAPASLPSATPAMLSGTGAALVRSAIALAQGGASLGDISLALGGEPTRLPAALPLRRDADLYEALRDRSDAYLAQHGQRPSAFLANLGPIPKHKARSSFATGFLNAGGIACIDNDGFVDADAACAAFEQSGASLVVLCGADDQYETWVEALAPKLTKAGAKAVILAGRGGEHEARYRSAGVTDFIFMGSDLIASLSAFLDTLGAQ